MQNAPKMKRGPAIAEAPRIWYLQTGSLGVARARSPCYAFPVLAAILARDTHGLRQNYGNLHPAALWAARFAKQI